MFNGNGLHALCLLFREQLGNAGLNVVEDFCPVLLFAEMMAQALLVVVQQLIGILVDVVELSEKVNRYVLFHTMILFNKVSFRLQDSHGMGNFCPCLIEFVKKKMPIIR